MAASAASSSPSAARAPWRLLLVAALAVLQLNGSAALPNVVLYVADDLGSGVVNQHEPSLSFFDDLAAIPPERRRIRTPTLARLAREGKRFFRAYSSPVCGPARHSLMTGIQVGAAYLKGNGYGAGGSADVDVEAGRSTIAAMLGSRGYRTAAVGKWGMSANATSPGSPCRQGFDSFYGKYTHFSMGAAFPDEMYSCSADDPAAVVVDARPENAGASASRCVRTSAGSSPCSSFDELIRAEALKFIGDADSGSSAAPFFLYWASSAGHSNFFTQVEGKAKVRQCLERTHAVPFFGRYTKNALQGTGSTSQAVRGLMSMAEYTVDEDMRLLLEALELAGKASDTLVVFTSDNGSHMEAFSDRRFNPRTDVAGTAGLRGIKRRTHEGGVRVPLIAWWPGMIPANSTSSYPLMLYDLALTIGQAAGVPSASPALQPFRGALAGGMALFDDVFAAADDAAAPSRDWIYTEVCFPKAAPGRGGSKRVCPKRWTKAPGCAFALYDVSGFPGSVVKLMKNEPDGPLQLYDVASDPFEEADLLTAGGSAGEDAAARAAALLALRGDIREVSCLAEGSYERQCHADDCAFHAARDDKAACWAAPGGMCAWAGSKAKCRLATCVDLRAKPDLCAVRADCLSQPWEQRKAQRCVDRDDAATSEAHALLLQCRSLTDTGRSSCRRNRNCLWLGATCDQRACAQLSRLQGICQARTDCSWTNNACTDLNLN